MSCDSSSEKDNTTKPNPIHEELVELLNACCKFYEDLDCWCGEHCVSHSDRLEYWVECIGKEEKRFLFHPCMLGAGCWEIASADDFYVVLNGIEWARLLQEEYDALCVDIC
jgi:hypothetical protein